MWIEEFESSASHLCNLWEHHGKVETKDAHLCVCVCLETDFTNVTTGKKKQTRLVDEFFGNAGFAGLVEEFCRACGGDLRV